MPEQRTKVTKRTEGAARPSSSFRSLPSLASPDNGGFIPPHGGYQELLSYQKALVVFQATLHFCDRFIDKKSRTHDQMVQAARSGNTNIAEGSQDSGTSKKMELKLVGVARGSLEELLGDYRDFLRQRGLIEWGKNHPMSGVVRRLCYAPNRSIRPIGLISKTPRRKWPPTPCSV